MGIEVGGGGFVEQVVIELGAGAGFVGVGDVLAQVVDGDAGAKLIHGGGGANCVRNLCAGDETGGGALAEEGALGEGAGGSALRQGDEDGPQHAPPDFCGSDFPELGLPEAFVGITLFFTTFPVETRLGASLAAARDGAGKTGQAPSLHEPEIQRRQPSCRLTGCIWTSPPSSKPCANAILTPGFSTIITITTRSHTAFWGCRMASWSRGAGTI